MQVYLAESVCPWLHTFLLYRTNFLFVSNVFIESTFHYPVYFQEMKLSGSSLDSSWLLVDMATWTASQITWSLCFWNFYRMGTDFRFSRKMSWVCTNEIMKRTKTSSFIQDLLNQWSRKPSISFTFLHAPITQTSHRSPFKVLC